MNIGGRLDWPWKLGLSILVAYPISGALWWLVKTVSFTGHMTWQDIPFQLMLLGCLVVMVPLFGGYIPKLFDNGSDEMYINLYPLIVPTAAIIFFVWSRGWKWFSRKP